MADKAAKFSFQNLPSKKFLSIEGKDVEDYLMKWSMKGRIKAQTFCFDQQFQPYMKDDFVLDFFKDPVVLSTLQVVSSSSKWVQIGVKAETVMVEPVKCSILSMGFFDKLQENNIVRESGYIVKCLDEYHEDMVISDELRKCLLLEDSDNYDLFSESERDEFLFRLFKHVCLGGAVCQYEDELKPYIDTTKLIYKDLISVAKDSAGQLYITSQVFKVTASDESGMYYPSDSPHEQNFAYFIVDALKRHVTVLYHKFGGGVF